MVTCRHKMMSHFDIWSRRFHDNKVLLAVHKIAEHNKVTFSKDPTLGTEPYYISGKVARRFPKESNGKITVYAIPTDKFEPLEYQDHCIHEIS